MDESIKCEEASLLLTKEKNLLPYKLDLYFNDTYINDFTLNLSFWISTVNYNRKIGVTTTTWSQVFLYKNRKRTPKPLTVNKNSSQPLVALQNLDATANHMTSS